MCKIALATAATLVLIIGCSGVRSTAPLTIPNTGSITSPDLSKKKVIRTFLLPAGSPPAEVAGVATGSDGNVWATEGLRNAIARITPDGVITEYPLPSLPGNALAGYVDIIGPGGDIWFPAFGYVGRITTAGSFSMYQLPAAAEALQGIAVGSDGNVWVTDSGRSSIHRVTPTGTVTEFQVPKGGGIQVWGITRGPDRRLWFVTTNFGPSAAIFGNITTSGKFTIYTPATNMDLRAIVTGPDGNLYASDFAGNGIVRITTSGVTTEYSTSASGVYEPDALTVGPDKQIWMTTYGGQLAEFNIKTNAVSAPIAMPSPGGANPLGYNSVTVGPDNDVWFTSGNEGHAQYVGVYEERVFNVGMNANDKPINDPNYGFELGYAIGAGTTTQTVVLTTGESVKFSNLDTTPHLAAFLGNATATSAPWPATFTGSTIASPAGTAIGSSGFSTGSIDPGRASRIYETGAPGFYMIGDQYDYASKMMRTVIIVR